MNTEGDHEFIYRGPLNDCCSSQAQQPLTPDAARKVVLDALASGRIRLTNHFRERARLRRFDLLDVQAVIRSGHAVGKGENCPNWRNVKYIFSGSREERTLTVVFALDPTQSYEATPLAILITGCWKKTRRNLDGRTKK